MRRFSARFVVVAGVLASGVHPVFSQKLADEAVQSTLSDQSSLPNAIDLKGPRPKADPSVLPPAATTLSPGLEPYAAPPDLALPNKPEQVRIRELRPLTLEQSLEIAEVNSPTLRAARSEVDQAQSALRAQIASWYPTLDLNAGALPQYLKSYQYRNPDFVPEIQVTPDQRNPLTGEVIREGRRRKGQSEFYAKTWSAALNVNVRWNIIDPQRVPSIAAARDQFELTGDSYSIALRDLRLQVAQAYFFLQQADEGVRIGQASVRASLVNLRDARARFNAGVNTKLDVLEQETQLARDRQVLTGNLGEQDNARRALASILDLPEDVTPTAATPARPIGLWEPSLQESIVAAFNYREELDQFILQISINNSQANAALAAVQPVLSFVNTTSTSRQQGQTGQKSYGAVNMDDYNWRAENTSLLTASWNLFDGGRARANYRRSKQAAEQSAINFAAQRNDIRRQVEESFTELRTSIQNIATTSSEVLSARESLRLSQLRVQAGVSTQREVVQNQRDLTQAELKYAQAIRIYNVSIAQLRRRTGLDALIPCGAVSLPSEKPDEGEELMPIEPTPLESACPAVVSKALPIEQIEASPVQPLW